MTPLNAMKQALEALEEANPSLSPNGRADRLVNEAITNLRTAIAELESAEPVAEWVLVPRTYTGEMAHAAFMAGDSGTIPNRFYMRLAEWWEAMLTAAPKQPAQSRDAVIEECAGYTSGTTERE